MKKKIIITMLSVIAASTSAILLPAILLFNNKTTSNQNNTLPPTSDNNNIGGNSGFDNLGNIGSNNNSGSGNINNNQTNPSKPNGTESPLQGIDKTYFKEKAKPITNAGTYSMATPGGGWNQNSITPSSSGPSRTAPSNGIAEDAPINKKFFYNEQEIKQSKRTVSLRFSNGGASNMGTGWILDYKLTEDGSYPLTWYFGTNSHVIQNLKVKGDVLTPERYENENNMMNTYVLDIRSIKNPQINKEYSNSVDDTSSFFSVGVFPKYDKTKEISSNLKTIFIGNDYLKTSPSMFSTSPRWKNSEEYIDFAVLEVTFDTVEQAKIVTHEYANLNVKDQFKYKNESLLKNQSAIIENGYKVIGYPNVVSANGDTWLNQATIQMFSSMPTNPTNTQKQKGTNLATSPYYNSFENKKGVFDAALVLSFFGYDYRKADGKTQFYNSWGLAYPVDYGKLGKGSSGSMLMDANGYTVGIHFAGDDRASMGLAQALYCEGFDYGGAYGSYNLEGYDLIKGGFPNQKNSYLDGLKKIYGKESNFKTNLFPNGLDKPIRAFN